MTAIIGFNLGACVLLIADTRTGSVGDGKDPQDGEQKIFKIPIGMATGSGTRAMIKAVVDKALKLNFSTSEFPAWMQRYRDQAKAENPDLDGAAAESLDRTRMIVTSIERAYSGVAVPRISVIAPTGYGNWALDDLGIGEVTICGATPNNDARDAWIARCREHMALPKPTQLDRADQPDELVASIVTSIQTGAEVMREIAASTPLVSPSFTIGVQYSGADVRISGPYDRPPDSNWLR